MSYSTGFPQGPAAGYPEPQGYPAPQGSFPPPGALTPDPPQGASSSVNITGSYEGIQFKIGHRDSNAVLYCRLQPGYELLSRPGSMVAMDASVQIQGKVNFSFKKMLTGGDLAFSHLFGQGEVLLAPETWGDIAAIRLDGSVPWFFGKHAYLASTREIVMNTKSQGLGKAFFSGHGLFTVQATGVGMLFVHSVGAIITRNLQPGESWVVNNDHLVAWNCQYHVEKIQAGGLLSTLKTDEGLVCRFQGPGTVYIMSRNPEQLIHWIAEKLPSRD
ncbi:hypothetical protein SCP_0308920 [Sparassis crispa]|uniref:Altered inheritance of mitochondria protein 24, mitochondrial n=1 Tax=Sparassis crispa TaxID=139825 RepID=A0A401GG53_9APHY|nr:hypothetical protein SCP_0308920 [Sparassis crispa]GBE81166.1 hypothetical protein SCP_0308920 [Sparassis crispa]